MEDSAALQNEIVSLHARFTAYQVRLSLAQAESSCRGTATHSLRGQPNPGTIQSQGAANAGNGSNEVPRHQEDTTGAHGVDPNGTWTCIHTPSSLAESAQAVGGAAMHPSLEIFSPQIGCGERVSGYFGDMDQLREDLWITGRQSRIAVGVGAGRCEQP